MDYVICPSCKGSGTTTLHGASFSASEWNDALNDNPDFADRYMDGTYDEPCEMCQGQRVMTRAAIREWEARWEDEAIQRAEQRVGA